LGIVRIIGDGDKETEKRIIWLGGGSGLDGKTWELLEQFDMMKKKIIWLRGTPSCLKYIYFLQQEKKYIYIYY
jgi:hypothetical protein